MHGYEIYLEQATLVYDSQAGPVKLLTKDGKVKEPMLKGGGDPIAAFAAELQTAVNAVRVGREPDLLSGKLARDALVLCHKECQSVRSGKPVSVA